MKQEYVETFLEIARTHNITKASENLHLAQSTVSQYLKRMEEDLGKPLFLRARGIKNVELTAYGEEFIPLAEKWISLLHQTEAFRTLEYMALDIAANDSLNDSVLFPVIDRMLTEHPAIHVKTRTVSSDFVYHLAENHEIDIGFAGYEAYRPNITAELSFEEVMCVVRNMTGCAGQKASHPKHFKEKDEILLKWGYAYQDWHDAHWNNTIAAFIETDSMILLRQYIYQPGKWAVFPRVELDRFPNKNLQICDLGSNAPPKRRIYQVIPRRIKPSHQAALELFLRYLREFILETPHLSLG